MDLIIGNKYKLRRLKDLYCNYLTTTGDDYLVNFNGEGLLNHQMDAYMGTEVKLRGTSYFPSRFLINGCDHSNFHMDLFEKRHIVCPAVVIRR